MTSIQQDTNSTRHVTIGTRQSKLALVQTEHVESCLRKLYPNFTFEIIKMATTGDKILDVALSKIGEKSLFTKELEVALENRTVDLVVHSLKDLPTTLPEGMALGAILEREDPNDALVLSKNSPGFTIDSLPAGSVIGTSSVRRISQLKRRFPHLKFIDVRGNLNTRLAKLDAADGPYSALILAVAGLLRLNMSDRISQILPRDVSLHAVGQGALGVECRENDLETLDIISKLDHLPTRQRCTAERAMMRTLEGGCSVPIGVNTTLVGDELTLEGAVVSLDGQKYVRHIETVKLTHDLCSAEKLGQSVADKLNAEGAEAILLEIKNSGTAPQLPFGK